MTHTPPPQDPHLEHWEPAPSPRRWPHAVAYTVLIAAVIILMAAVLADEEPTVPKSSGSLPTESADDLVDPADVPTDVAPEPEPEPTPDEDLSVRGNEVAAFSDTIGVYDTWDDTHMADVTVTDVEVTTEGQWDNQFADDPPENGFFVIITLEGTTSQEMTADDYWSISDRDFALFTPDGTRVNEPSTSAAWSALDPVDDLPTELGPGEKFAGKIALDSPTENGVIAYAGVEWEF